MSDISDISNRRFYVSSVGDLYMVSLRNWGQKIVDLDGKEIAAEDMVLDQKAFVEFQGPTTTTRTSITRIA